MIVVSHESHDMYNPIFVLINPFEKKNGLSAAPAESQSYAIAAIATDGPSKVCYRVLLGHLDVTSTLNRNGELVRIEGDETVGHFEGATAAIRSTTTMVP